MRACDVVSSSKIDRDIRYQKFSSAKGAGKGLIIIIIYYFNYYFVLVYSLV